jgi:hypothetical protein
VEFCRYQVEDGGSFLHREEVASRKSVKPKSAGGLFSPIHDFGFESHMILSPNEAGDWVRKRWFFSTLVRLHNA